jgi:competence protein ComEC
MYAFLEAVAPKIAVLTIGPNPYGAPHPKTLKAYSKKGCRVFRTDTFGAVRIKTDGQKIWWETGGR